MALPNAMTRQLADAGLTRDEAEAVGEELAQLHTDGSTLENVQTTENGVRGEFVKTITIRRVFQCRWRDGKNGPERVQLRAKEVHT